MENSVKLKKISNFFCSIAIIILMYACYFNAIKTISISYIATLVIALICLVIAFLLSSSKKIIIYFPSILFFLVILYSKIFTINENTTNRFLTTYLIYMLISFLITGMKKWEKSLQIVSIVFSSITAIVTIMSWISPEWYINNIIPTLYSNSQATMYNLVQYAKSYPGIFASTGLNAFFISVGVAILFSMIIFKRKNSKIAIGLIIIHIFALLLTLKRATLVLNILSILVILLLNNSNARKKVKFLIIGIIVVCLSYCIFPQVFNNTLSRFQTNSEEEFFNGRTELYDFAKKSIEKNFFYGYGFGCFSKAYARYNTYNGIPLDTHNEILQIASETGVLGVPLIFIPLIYMYIYTIKRFKKIKNNSYEKYSIAISIYIQTYFLTYLFVGNPFHDSSIYLTYLLFTLSAVIRKEKSDNEGSFNNNSSI